MHGMDKRHDGHAWPKTITSHIKNDMSLTLCTSICVGHLRSLVEKHVYGNRNLT
jgi:hypothetical protein